MRKFVSGILGGSLLMTGVATATTVDHGSINDSLVNSSQIKRLSIGFDGLLGRRGLSLDGDAKLKMDTRILCFSVGYDIFSWLTPYVIVGVGQAKFDNNVLPEYNDMKANFGGGVDLNLWHMDINDPELMSGRFIVRGTAEYMHYQTGDSDQDVHWNDFFFAVPLNYEFFAGQPSDTKLVPYSMTFSVGPAFSSISGRMNVEMEGLNFESNFREDTNFGLLMGGTLMVAHNVSIGYNCYYFSEFTHNVNVRFHF